MGLGNILGDFFTNSSGRPDFCTGSEKKQSSAHAQKMQLFCFQNASKLKALNLNAEEKMHLQ
jgi:hypothetical protein